MFPFLERLVLFLIAISVIRSVLRFIQGLGIRMRMQTRTRVNRSAAGSSDAPGATMLRQDPVCGTYVAIDASLKRIVNGQVVHFCSAECRDKFRG